MLDIGSGFQSLRTHIDPSCTYQPCDVVAKTPDTWFIDFNADVYPIVDVSFDVVVCSGVLEYSERPEKFLGRIRSFGHSFLVSYAVALPDLSPRQLKTRGWRNAFTQSGIGGSVRITGIHIRASRDLGNQAAAPDLSAATPSGDVNSEQVTPRAVRISPLVRISPEDSHDAERP